MKRRFLFLLSRDILSYTIITLLILSPSLIIVVFPIKLNIGAMRIQINLITFIIFLIFFSVFIGIVNPLIDAKVNRRYLFLISLAEEIIEFHCYDWNQKVYFKDISSLAIDFGGSNIIYPDTSLRSTRLVFSLIGGEDLKIAIYLYSKDELFEILEKIGRKNNSLANDINVAKSKLNSLRNIHWLISSQIWKLFKLKYPLEWR